MDSEKHAPATPRGNSRIPEFKTVQEEAAFWETHDSMEFEDEFEPVTDVTFVRSQPKKGLTVRLAQDSLAALTKQAHEKGIGPSTLARMWILERLRQEAGTKSG
jgi:predicted DNA binding CopG/RHH family protein